MRINCQLTVIPAARTTQTIRDTRSIMISQLTKLFKILLKPGTGWGYYIAIVPFAANELKS